MKKTAFLLFTTMAIPALAISQTTVNPTAAQAPVESKPVLPGDPAPLPVVPSVPVPVEPPAPIPVVPPVVSPVAPPVVVPVVPRVTVPVVPPVVVPVVPRVRVPVFPPAPPEDKAKPGEAAPTPFPMPEPNERKGKGKGRPEDKEKDAPKKPAPMEPVRPFPVPETKPVPDPTPPVAEEGMKRPSQRPKKSDVNAPPPTAPANPTPAPDPEKRPSVPGTRPAPSPSMPAQPPGVPSPAVTPPPVRAADSKDVIPPAPPERPVAQMPPSKETAKVLEDQGKRDRKADAQQAGKIEDKDDAKRLLMTILGGALGAVAGDRQNQPRPGDRPGERSDRPGDRSMHGYRPSVEEVGRTQLDRERNVGLMVQRFQGRTPQSALPNSPRRDPRSFENNQTQRSFETSQTQRHTHFYEGNRRVVRYSSMQEIPPVIVASQRLNRVQVIPLSQSTYNARPQGAPQGQYYNEVPQSYTADNAYAVSYGVDPDSAISTNDILFRQGSTDFADAYSYDLVIDVAEAMNAPALLKETFVIEGHASAEGDYGQNLLLSQERAERISRELVRYGVSAERLMPVGYGETEAAHPANAGESERRLDRRVMVFRMR